MLIIPPANLSSFVAEKTATQDIKGKGALISDRLGLHTPPGLHGVNNQVLTGESPVYFCIACFKNINRSL